MLLPWSSFFVSERCVPQYHMPFVSEFFPSIAPGADDGVCGIKKLYCKPGINPNKRNECFGRSRRH